MMFWMEGDIVGRSLGRMDDTANSSWPVSHWCKHIEEASASPTKFIFGIMSTSELP